MKKIVYLNIPVRDFVDAQYHLQEGVPFEGVDDDLARSWSVNFGAGFEADLNVYNGSWDLERDCLGAPWAEAVLFENGGEVSCCEPSDGIAGDWHFFMGDDEYIVFVGITLEEKQSSYLFVEDAT